MTEQERARATVQECELRFRRTRSPMAVAGEALRRATRASEIAEEEFQDATRRLTRMEVAQALGETMLRVVRPSSWYPGESSSVHAPAAP